MPAYIKIGDIKGESTDRGATLAKFDGVDGEATDRFEFRDVSQSPAARGKTDPVDLMILSPVETGAGSKGIEWTYTPQDDGGDSALAEEVSLGYMEIEWTY